MSSRDYCQVAGASLFQFGRRLAQIQGTATDQLEVRNSANTATGKLTVANGVVASDAVNLSQLSAVAAGLAWLPPADVCTDVALSANTQTTPNTLTVDAAEILVVDGVTVALNEVVLVKEEGGGSSTKNGVYFLSTVGTAVIPWVLTRRVGEEAGDDATSNAIFCSGGTAGANTAFVQINDGALYNTNATDFNPFADITGGVTSLATAAGVTGITVLDSGAAPIPTLRGVRGETGVLTAALSGTDIEVSVDTGGIATAKLADLAVTAPKLGVNASLIRACFTITDADQGTTATGPTLEPNSVVVRTEVNVGVDFDDLNTTVDVQVDAVSVQGASESDLAITGVQTCDGEQTTVAAAVVTAVVTGSANTQGSAEICVYYYVGA